jgi:hypothetical protein
MTDGAELKREVVAPVDSWLLGRQEPLVASRKDTISAGCELDALFESASEALLGKERQIRRARQRAGFGGNCNGECVHQCAGRPSRHRTTA